MTTRIGVFRCGGITVIRAFVGEDDKKVSDLAVRYARAASEFFAVELEFERLCKDLPEEIVYAESDVLSLESFVRARKLS